MRNIGRWSARIFPIFRGNSSQDDDRMSRQEEYSVEFFRRISLPKGKRERRSGREDDGGGGCEPRFFGDGGTESLQGDDGAILPRRVYDESAYFGDEMPYIKF